MDYIIIKDWLSFDGFDNNPLQHISFATYRDGSLYNSLCLFLIISFKLYIAVFITTLINMQNYRQKTISPNILILFKKKSNNSNYGDFAIIRRVPTLLPM